MKKRYTEEQIIGFLREADAGVPIGSRQDDHRSLALATGIQPRTTQESARRSHPSRLCPATRRSKHGMISNRTLGKHRISIKNSERFFCHRV